jgi:F0F1-type ATP synthase epsilon subunit
MSLRTGSGRSGLLELQQRRTDEADLVRLGFAPAPRSHGDVLRDYAAEAQRLDQLGERERVKRAEEQLAVRTERVAQPERQLEAEGQGHARS